MSPCRLLPTRSSTTYIDLHDHHPHQSPRRDQHYWILGTDGEREPPRRDGEGWALIGGGHLDNVEVLSDEPIEFMRVRTKRINWADHLRYPG